MQLEEVLNNIYKYYHINGNICFMLNT